MFLGSLNENIEQCKQLVRDSMQIHPEVLRLAATINHSTTEVIEFLIIFFFYFFFKKSYLQTGERRQVGIISNHSTEWFEAYSQKGGVLNTFSPSLVVVSQDVGFAKPDFMIYQVSVFFNYFVIIF